MHSILSDDSYRCGKQVSNMAVSLKHRGGPEPGPRPGPEPGPEPGPGPEFSWNTKCYNTGVLKPGVWQNSAETRSDQISHFLSIRTDNALSVNWYN